TPTSRTRAASARSAERSGPTSASANARPRRASARPIRNGAERRDIRLRVGQEFLASDETQADFVLLLPDQFALPEEIAAPGQREHEFRVDRRGGMTGRR